MFQAVVPVLNQHDTTAAVMDSWFTLAKSRLRVIFIDNGSDEPLVEQQFVRGWSKFHDITVLRNDQNTGVYPTFQQGLDAASECPFIFYSHNDVEMLQYGWDEKMSRILKRLSAHPDKPGVCGMFGALGIGTPDLYVKPYHFTQLMRRDCITVDGMHEDSNMAIESDAERIIVLDGFSLIVSRKMIQEVMNGRFDHERFPPHHMYDIDICVSSHRGGFANWVIDVDCKHHGGVTSTREDWATEMGSSDLAIHREAHRVFYEKWRNKLPMHLGARLSI